MSFRITYSVLNADLTELHREFDAAMEKVRGKLGKDHSSYVGLRAVKSEKFFEKRNPADTRELLGRFGSATLASLDEAMKEAVEAQVAWGLTPWQERVRIIKKAADLISERRLELAAIMVLEVGKNRLEALGDVEESADLFRYYADQLVESNGFLKPLGKLSPNEDTRSVLRPYGVFGVISPFNFPMALAAGMAGSALLGGNAVVLKPSQEAPWCGETLRQCLMDAGLAPGLFHLLHGEGSELGEAIVKHPKTAGIAFTGSKAVGMRILSTFNTVYPKPALLELGGKNPAFVCESADLDQAAEGCARSAFGMSGQKCSALSRVYVHEKIKDAFVKKLIEKTEALTAGEKTGNPALASTYLGPVISENALKKFQAAVEVAKRDGKILHGGNDLRKDPRFANGWFAAPTIVEAPREHAMFRDEYFAPFLALTGFKDLANAIQYSNQSEYGLTAGIFSAKKEEIDLFMDRLENGVLYANRRTGATTGAWPGVQAFCGWKGSGSTGKGGCGPYYVSQFMREQSQTRML